MCLRCDGVNIWVYFCVVVNWKCLQKIWMRKVRDTNNRDVNEIFSYGKIDRFLGAAEFCSTHN